MKTELLYNSPVWVTLASKEVSKWVRRFPRNVFGHLYFPLSIDGFFYLKFDNQAGVLSDGPSYLKKPSFLNPIPLINLPLSLFSFSSLPHQSVPFPFQTNRFIERKTIGDYPSQGYKMLFRQPYDKYHLCCRHTLESTP